MKNCKKCGEEFEPQKGLVNYCSMKCRQGKNWTEEDKEKKSLSAKNSLLVKIDKEKRIKKIKIHCLHCNHEFYTIPAKLKQKFCSVECANNSESKKSKCRINGLKSAQKKIKRSKNEILFFSLCKEVFEDAIHNVPMFNGWDADIILPSKKIAILWNGVWHYKKIKISHSLEQVQNRDKIKEKEINKLGYTLYVIKDMGKHNIDFVNDEFKKFINMVM